MDAVWGQIKITPLALKFVDVYEFQRMRAMKQLGTCNYVFTSAEMSRFSHSIGVYHLACRVMDVLRSKYPDVVTDRHVMMVPIAALYHDIGHGPLSHVFDHITGTNHEDRSKAILRFVIEKYNIDDFTNEEVTMMQDMMEPTKDDWYYNIVSNSTADVDRMDYLIRDSFSTGVHHMLGRDDVLKLIDRSEIVDGRWYFPTSVYYIVDDLLVSRKHMYERVYRHPTTLRINEMISVTTKKLFDSVSTDLGGFLKLNDAIVMEIYNDPDTPLYHKAILDNVFTRKFAI
jgi:HD superfamily phosphohydrolase